MNADSWKPVELDQLRRIIAAQLEECSAALREHFEAHRVEFYRVPIRRLGKLESVFVVATFDDAVLYYEDVEEGFELASLDENGAIASQGCNQFELCQILTQLTA